MRSVEVDMRMELKGVTCKQIVNGEVLERELEEYRKKCNDLEERSRKDEERCILLEGMLELLESKFHELKVEKVGIQDEFKVLNRRNTELEEQINEFEKKNNDACEDNVTYLMIENKVLECEKKMAENEAEAWKLKFRKLKSRVLELEQENSVLRNGQSQLHGMMESDLEMNENQTSKASNVKDVILSEHLDTEYKMLNDNKTVHAAVSSTCCSPVNGIGDFQAAVTPLIDMPSKHFKQADGRKRGPVSEDEKNHRSRVIKQLEFGAEGSLSMKMAPSTPSFPRHSTFGVVDISDSEDEVANVSIHTPCDGNRMACVSTDFLPGPTTMDNENKKTSDGNFKTPLYQSDEEDMKDYEGSFLFIRTPKRKRASNIVTTDSETDSEDTIPICKLKMKHLLKSNHDSVDVNGTLSEENINESATRRRRRRRLVALRECNVKNETEQKSHCNSNKGGANYDSRIPTNAGVENDEMEETEFEPDTEGESLDGFIVKSSDISESADGSNESEHVSDDNVDFNEVLSTIRRSRDVKVKWEFEADMLAAFGKDLELCMKAVCALYRKQTIDEKLGKITCYSNQQGFSQCHARRGSKLAEFLTDGDGQGDVKKSVEELRAYDPKAPGLCRTLATHYSKQLFAIYNAKEDHFFLPS